jgi:tetrahydromethanopterin S-methyltransferase subunit A
MSDKVEVYNAETSIVEARISDIKTRIMMIGRETRFASGFYVGIVKGFTIGITTSLILFGFLLHYLIR